MRSRWRDPPGIAPGYLVDSVRDPIEVVNVAPTNPWYTECMENTQLPSTRWFKKISWPWIIFSVLYLIDVLNPASYTDLNWSDWTNVFVSIPSYVVLVLIAFRRRWLSDRGWKIYAVAFPIVDIFLNVLSPRIDGKPFWTTDTLFGFLFECILYAGLIQYAWKGRFLYWSPASHFETESVRHRRRVALTDHHTKWLWGINIFFVSVYVLATLLVLLATAQGLVDKAKPLGAFGSILAGVDVAIAVWILWEIIMTSTRVHKILYVLMVLTIGSLSKTSWTAIILGIMLLLYWPIHKKLQADQAKTSISVPPPAPAQ